MRAMALMVAMCLVMAHVSDAEAARKKKRSKKAPVAQSLGVNDPRYATIIMNPTTGEVYHAHDADQQRYPASLTKVMTLYLLFDAIQRGDVDLDDSMEVSALAARQPQTNLSLDPDDRIDVDTAIKSLVVRSANDVSVVVAEHLGGSVENFARLMTDQARVLGMKNTTFKNPNGLPNAGQVTTARDMAKLGIAIKRDFPKFYHYFSTLQFSHNGVTYYTHNRVLMRYAGADGIKTGYINASGFNLITSVVRGGRPVVGVVMGGGSGKWRDNRMITLLDEAYRTIASRGGARGKPSPANLPQSREGKSAAPEAEAATVPSSQPAIDANNLPENDDAEDTAGMEEAEESAAPMPKPSAPAVIKPPVAHTPSRARVIELAPTRNDPPPERSPFAVMDAADRPVDPSATPERAAPSQASASAGMWGIQVGAFSSKEQAEAALSQARQLAPKSLIDARTGSLVPLEGATPVYRARYEGLTQAQARKACEQMISANAPCFTFMMAPVP